MNFRVTFDSTLDDSLDVKARIQKATGAFAKMSKMLRERKISKTLRLRIYKATVLNILLFGCECWALKAEDRRKLESCHHRFLRSMLHITMSEVKEQHIKNEDIRNEFNNCRSLEQSMELRRARWLQKLATMDENRNPRKILLAWTPDPRPTGRPFQTVSKAYAHTVKNVLGMDTRLDAWIPIAKDTPMEWGKIVEEKLELTEGSYTNLMRRRRPTGNVEQ